MELIYENVPQRHVIRATNRTTNSRLGGGGGVGTGGVLVVPPGQVVLGGSTINDRRSTVTISSNNSSNNNSSHNSSGGEDEHKRLTQNIAAVAAQRRATQHHKDLMLELGELANTPPPNSTSPNRVYNPQAGNLKDDAKSNKKKKVKIKEIVQYKLPDEAEYQKTPYDDDYELVYIFHCFN